jgi:hypothetical protein
MNKVTIALIATTILLVGSLTWTAEAQTTRGVAAVAGAAKNFTPIEKAACGPFWGRWCGPFSRRVCGPYRCWCAPC